MALPLDHYLHPSPPVQAAGIGEKIMAKPPQPKRKKLPQDDIYWRLWSKMVAYLDLVLISITLPMFVYCIAVNSQDLVNPPPPDEDEHLTEKRHDEIKRVAISLTTVLIMSFIGITASIKLICATDPRRHPYGALPLARFWKHVNLVFLGFGLLSIFYTASLISCAINLMMHSILITVVCLYIQELENYVFYVLPVMEGTIMEMERGEQQCPHHNDKLPTVSVIVEREIK